MSKPVTVQFYLLGPYLVESQIIEILKPSTGNTTQDLNKLNLESFFNLPITSLSEEILTRYCEITCKDLFLPLFLSNEDILNKLIRPLRSAKRNYCFGDYLSSIALSGLVGEMLAIIAWKISSIGIKGKRMTDKEEKDIFGRAFEKLGQERRLKILQACEEITQKQYEIFCDLKGKRDQYLHSWDINLKNEKLDAFDAYKSAFLLFKEIAGIEIKDARSIKFNNPKIKQLLENISLST